MATYTSRLNSIEYSVTTNLSGSWNPSETGWLGSVKFANSHKTAGQEYDYKTTTVSEGDTYGNSPKLLQKITRVYSASFKQGKKNMQNYREHKTFTMSGFLSCLDPTVAPSVDLNKNVLYMADFKSNATNKIQSPTSVNFSFTDLDTETVNKKAQISNLDRNVSGHIVRNRVKSNIVTLTATWSNLDATQTKKLLQWVSASQYLRVGFYNPITGNNEFRAMYNNARTLEVHVRGRFKDISVSFVEV